MIGLGSSITDPDTIRVFSKGIYFDADGTTIVSSDSIISIYAKQSLDFVPKFEAALSIATDQFNFNMAGSSLISGNERSGACADKPAITVPDIPSATKVADGAGTKLSSIKSSETNIEIDPSITHSPVDELIARLADLPGTEKISGNFKGELGTKDNPGVFFVENYAKLTGGISEGYGIMVIRSGGNLEYEGSLDVAGNFTFNGLIVFENAFDFDSRGTPSLNGSVLVGNTKDNYSAIDIDISGNLALQYDCEAVQYAKIASSKLLKQNRYKRLNTFE